jgi:hypothetical protein
MKKVTARRRRSSQKLQAEFQRHVLEKLQEAERLSRDKLGAVCNLIEDLGAVGVAKMLVDPQDIRSPPDGFLRLMKSDLARFTIEQAIVDFCDSGLFTASEVETARARLAIYSRKSSR